MKTFDLKNNPKQLRNALIIAGSAVTVFAVAIVAIGVIGANINNGNEKKAETIYANMVDMLNTSGKVEGDTMQSIISYTYNEKTRRIMVGAVGQEKLFVYNITLNDKKNNTDVMKWFFNNDYKNKSYVENEYVTYAPLDKRLDSFPKCDEITYQIYQSDELLHKFSACGTYRIGNVYYSFTGYELDDKNNIDARNIKYSVKKTNSLAYNFMKLIMQ